MKIAFTAFPLEKNLKAKKELEKKYGIHKPEDADIIVSLGGDGFVLKSLHEYLKLSKPIFGMNFGNVGFLMNSHSIENLEERIEKAQLLKLKPLIMKTVNPTGQVIKALAINEVSIRREKYQAAKLKIEIDGVTFKITRTNEDGFIVKTIKLKDGDLEYTFHERVKALTKEDFMGMFHRNGLEILDIFGGYNLDKFDPEKSSRLILIGRNT